MPVPSTADCWFRAAHLARVHDACSPVDRRILYNMGRWAKNGWTVPPRMFDRASMALCETLSDAAARKEWVDDVGAVNARSLVAGLLRPATSKEGGPALSGHRHAVCARCGNGWPFDTGEDCPRCGEVVSRIWWFEADGRVTEVRYLRKHNRFGL